MKESWKNPALYKTRICDNWSMGHPCKYNLNCWYAHGPRELRSVPHLESDPIAKTMSLVEVMNILPPSRTRDNAVNHVSNMMTDVSMDLFKRFTVPTLNAIVSGIASGKQPSALPTQLDPSVQLLNNLVPLLMQTANMSPPQNQPIQHPQTNRFIPKPEMHFMHSDNGAQRPPLTHLSRNSVSSSSVQSNLSSKNGHSSMRNIWAPSSEDHEENSMFETIRQCYDADCNNFFI